MNTGVATPQPSGEPGIPLDGQPVYFAAADRQMELFVDVRSRRSLFLKSLIHGILFEPTGVVIPDSFLFISQPLWDHVEEHHRKKSLSLVEAGVRDDFLVPAFRDKTTRSFMDARDLILTQELQGQLPDPYTKRLAQWLDKAKPSGSVKAVYWPDHSVGNRLGERLADFLGPHLEGRPDRPPTTSEDVLEVWDRTRPWRTRALEAALRKGPERGGFRRGDYMNELGRDLGMTGPVHDMVDLIGACASARDRHAMQVLCLWINETYQFNQARELGLDAAFPNYDAQYSLATLSALSRGPVDPFWRRAEWSEVKLDARLPPPEVLATSDGGRLMDIRSGRPGTDYFEALAHWRVAAATGEDARERRWLSEEFRSYTRALSAAAGQRALPFRLRVGHVLSGSTALGSAAAAQAALNTLAPELAAGGNAAVALAGFGWTAYSWLAARPRAYSETVRARVGMTVVDTGPGPTA